MIWFWPLGREKVAPSRTRKTLSVRSRMIRTHEQPPPPLGWRQSPQHIHRNGIDDPTKPQSKSFIHRVKGPDAPDQTESNIIIHPAVKGPDFPDLSGSKVIIHPALKGHDAPDHTESKIIIHPEFPTQQNNLLMPSPKNVQQLCPFNSLSSIRDEQHHLPQLNASHQTATHRRLTMTRPADNKFHLMPASTILAPIAILLIATRLHRRTQQSAISYSKSSASADAEARPLP